MSSYSLWRIMKRGSSIQKCHLLSSSSSNPSHSWALYHTYNVYVCEWVHIKHSAWLLYLETEYLTQEFHWVQWWPRVTDVWRRGNNIQVRDLIQRFSILTAHWNSMRNFKKCKYSDPSLRDSSVTGEGMAWVYGFSQAPWYSSMWPRLRATASERKTSAMCLVSSGEHWRIPDCYWHITCSKTVGQSGCVPTRASSCTKCVPLPHFVLKTIL